MVTKIFGQENRNEEWRIFVMNKRRGAEKEAMRLKSENDFAPEEKI